MATIGSSYSGMFNSMESKKRRSTSELNCHGVPLPYMIRPRKTSPPIDYFGLWNEYASDMNNESDEDVSDETSSLTINCFGVRNDSDAKLAEMDCSVNDVEYVIVNRVDDMHSSKKERVGAIQMMELCKDFPESPKASAKDVMEAPKASDAISEKKTVDESKSEDEAESSGDEWVVV